MKSRAGRHWQGGGESVASIAARLTADSEEWSAYDHAVQAHARSHGHKHEAMSRPLKWGLVAANCAAAAGELVAGKVVNTLSSTADAFHNLGDAASYLMQANNIRNRDSYSEDKLYRRRWLSHGIIAGSSLVAGGLAIKDMVQQHTAEYGSNTVTAALGSLAVSGALWMKFEHGLNKRDQFLGARSRTAEDQDVRKHILKVDMPSAGLAVAGALAHKHGLHADIANASLGTGIRLQAEHVAAAVSAGIGTWLFRPTQKNLAHDHAHHAPAHAGSAAPSAAPEPRRAWKERISGGVRNAVGRAQELAYNIQTGSDEKTNNRLKRVVQVGAVATAGAVLWKMTGGAFSLGGNTVNHLIAAGHVAPDAVSAPASALPMQPSEPLPPPALPATPAYTPAVMHLEHGEGPYQTMQELGIPASQRPELLDSAGPQLADLEYSDGSSVAYYEDFDGQAAGEWRWNMSPNSQIDPRALQIMTDEVTQ